MSFTLVILFSMLTRGTLAAAAAPTASLRNSSLVMKAPDDVINCHLTSFEVDAGNVLNVKWTSDDVISNTSAPVVCLLRLGLVSDRSNTSTDCDTLKPVTETLAVGGQHAFWNVSSPGNGYVLCSRQYSEADNRSARGDWSYLMVSNELRLPPVVNNCTVFIRGVRSTMTASIDMKSYYFFDNSRSIRIACDVMGWPIPTVRWCKESPACSDAGLAQNGNHVVITSASQTDEGSYFMTSSNKYGSLTVGGFSLKMAVAKPLPQKASNIAIEAGKSIHLPCHEWKNSVPNARVTWHRIIDKETNKRVAVKLSHRVAQVDGSLIFVNTHTNDSGLYICRVNVGQLQKSEYGNIYEYTVIGHDRDNYGRSPERVDIDVLNNNRLVHGVAGSAVQLACMFIGYPQPTVEWYHNNRLLLGNNSRHQWTSGHQVLDISPVLVEDEGQYACSAINSLGSTTNQMRLQVFAMPYITADLKSVNASSGSTVSFHCNASGAPHPAITWYINDDEYPNQARDGRIVVSGNTMTVRNVSANDVMVIRCNASNYYGYALTAGYLNVYESTQIIEVVPDGLNITVTSNDDAVQPVPLRCRGKTDPQTIMSVTWSLSYDTVDSCSDVIWQLSDQKNSSATLTTNSLRTLIARWQQRQTNLSRCCRNVLCLAANDLIDGSSAAVVRICLSPAEEFTTSASQSELMSPIGVLSSTMWSILMIGGLCLVVITLLAFTSLCLVKHLVPSKRRQQKMLQQQAQSLQPLQQHVLMDPSTASICDATLNRSRRLGSTSSDCSVMTMSTGATYCGVHGGANGRQTFGRGATLSRQISAFSSAGSTDCLVRENCSPTTGPLTHLTGQLQMAINEMFIPRDRIRLEQAIGNGQFGRVFSAELEDARRKLREHVAVKTMKFKADETEMVELFLREAVIMKDFRHPNVLHIVGVTFDVDSSPMVVLPFMANGDLRQYILNPSLDITILELLKLGLQVAEGMLYLSNLRFVHRDLAARNCMVTERRVVKVADFGLSRELLLRDYYRSDGSGMTPVPVRWLALECLEASVFTTMSDVWSYGVLLWELMTRGAVPYSEIDNWQIASYVQNGKRLEQPDYCPDAIYGIMHKCWNDNAVQRPTFSQLAQWIGEITSSAVRSGIQTNTALYQNVLGNSSGPSNSLNSISSKSNNVVGRYPSTSSDNECVDESASMICAPQSRPIGGCQTGTTTF